ncbi:hypothetical protein EXE44_15560 [Halorubrum sp. SS7]|nr:hypothetical protein [Halorubrum sp. SP3]TKX53659.1 hypothetical protein EXE42_12005 [Halorubrum sp. SP3]TKX56313.1 hypothetical protein EXE44_15560 [Halorubrum sp. SS7]TKX56790.1 hypothetical protein EXE45_17965 [Halorubrum sp. SP9]
MPEPDPPFDVDHVAKLIEIHGYATTRDKQREIEREIIDATVGEHQAEWLSEQREEARSDDDSASIEARREALRKMG